MRYQGIIEAVETTQAYAGNVKGLQGTISLDTNLHITVGSHTSNGFKTPPLLLACVRTGNGTKNSPLPPPAEENACCSVNTYNCCNWGNGEYIYHKYKSLKAEKMH